MTRLALCITELDLGGAERMFCELAAGLDRDRFSPVVYSLMPKPREPANSCLPILEKAGIPVEFLDMKGTRSFLAGLGKLTRHFRTQRPQVVQSFMFHANFLARLAAARTGIRNVFSGIRVAEKDSPWRLRLDRWTDRWVEKHVCVSRSVMEFAEKTAKLPKEKLVCIPNGIDPAPFIGAAKADLGGIEIVPDSKKAICIGRLHPQKGIDRLLELWAGLKLFDWELLVVGDGPEREKLFAQRDSIPDPAARSRVHFLGRRGDIPELLAASHLLVLPSRWEGMPNVVLQAMAAGLPVLASRCEGVAELLGERFDPQSWDFDSAEMFYERFSNLSADVVLRSELGRKNRVRVAENFSIKSMLDAYQNLWDGNRVRGFS